MSGRKGEADGYVDRSVEGIGWFEGLSARLRARFLAYAGADNLRLNVIGRDLDDA